MPGAVDGLVVRVFGETAEVLHMVDLMQRILGQ